MTLNVNGINERSAETLPLHEGTNSEELQNIKNYKRQAVPIVMSSNANAPQIIGDKISQIEENDDIPIYYSDHTSDKMGQLTANIVENRQ